MKIHVSQIWRLEWSRTTYELLQTRVLIPERALIGYSSASRTFSTQVLFTEEKQALEEAKKYTAAGNIQIDVEKQSRYVGALTLPAREITQLIQRGRFYDAMEKRVDDTKCELIRSMKTLVDRLTPPTVYIS